jgi:molybdenum cofactor synthesis domain-containing protein
VKAAVLIASDSCFRGERVDASGAHIADRLAAAGWEIVETRIVPDDAALIAEALRGWADRHAVDLVVTTGGTGLSARDVTPEATAAVVDRRAPGLAEALRSEGARRTPNAWLSRGEAGLRGTTLIVNLPGSLGAARDGMELLLPLLAHALAMMHGEGH